MGGWEEPILNKKKMFTLVCTNGFSKPCTTLILMQAEIRLQLKGGTPVVFALLF